MTNNNTTKETTMEDMIREIQVQVDFYSSRFQANGHRTDREMVEFYQNWISQLIVDQERLKEI
jgi:hypothetical protein